MFIITYIHIYHIGEKYWNQFNKSNKSSLIYVDALDQNKGIRLENYVYKTVDMIYYLFVGTVSTGRMLPWHDIVNDNTIMHLFKIWKHAPDIYTSTILCTNVTLLIAIPLTYRWRWADVIYGDVWIRAPGQVILRKRHSHTYQVSILIHKLDLISSSLGKLSSQYHISQNTRRIRNWDEI